MRSSLKNCNSQNNAPNGEFLWMKRSVQMTARASLTYLNQMSQMQDFPFMKSDFGKTILTESMQQSP
jgi:hypothetical protein